MSTITDGKDFNITGEKIEDMVITFFSTCFFSILIGLVMGIISTLLFKYLRFLSNSAITENAGVLILGMMTY